MKIILDDRRPLPEESVYNCVRTYEDCIFLIRNFHTITFISLDYNLGTQKTGYDVLKYMLENGNDVKHINIHSDNSFGVPLMREFVREHFPNTTLTFNRI